MELKIKQSQRNRLSELAQKWNKKTEEVLENLLEKSLAFYEFEFTNAGKKWDYFDKEKLIYLFNEKVSYEEICQKLLRTRSAIMSKLNDLGYLHYNKETGKYEKTGKR